MSTRDVLHVPVEWKATGSTAGELEGYASVFGNVDEIGDVVMPGAFRKTISDWKRASQPMPLIADHVMSTDGVIGSISALEEKAHGLWFKARFSRSEKAQRIRQDVLDGHFRGTSFTYEVIKGTPGSGTVGGKAVSRYLDEVRLYEITLSPFPVNQLAGVTAAKASAVVATAYAGWLDSVTHAIAIVDPAARKAAIDYLVRSYPGDETPDLAAGQEDAPVTADGAAIEDGGTPTPDDAYAVSFLHQYGPSDGAPDGEPQNALPGPLVELEHGRSIKEIDTLETEIQAALGGDHG